MTNRRSIASEDVVEQVHQVTQDLVPGGAGGVQVGVEEGSGLEGLPGLGDEYGRGLGHRLHAHYATFR